MTILNKLFQNIKDPLHKNALFLMLNSLGTSGFGFIFWMIVAIYYTPHEVGIASAIISCMILLAMLSNLGFGIGLIRFLPEVSNKDSNDMINSCFTISGLFSLVLVTVFLLGLEIWSPALLLIRDNLVYIILFGMFTITWMFTSMLNNIFISRRSAKYAFYKDSFVFSLMKIVILFVLIPFGAYGIFSAWGISATFAFIIFLFLFLPRSQVGYKPNLIVKKHTIKTMLRFSFGNYIGENFKELPRLVLPLIIINILTPSDAGYFYIAWIIATLLLMIPISTSRSLLAEGSIKVDSFKISLKKGMKLIFALLIPSVLLIILFGDILLSLLGKSYSENASEMLQWFAISSLPFAINILFITCQRITKKVGIIIVTYGVLGFGTLGLSYFLIKDIGISGVGIAWFVTQSLISAFTIIPLMKIMMSKN